MNSWFETNLVCPRDHEQIRIQANKIICSQGHEYPFVDGIPIMLLSDVEATHQAHFQESYQAVNEPQDSAMQGISREEGVDPYVQQAIVGTCGLMYRNLLGKLKRYPLPDFPLPPVIKPNLLLDIGCNWGRWCLSAASHGFTPIGIDPSFKAIQAARRVAAQLKIEAYYLVADARHLPFAAGKFDVVFSYSVLQHFAKYVCKKVLRETKRVLKASGYSMIEMLNSYGLRNFYNVARRGFREARNFEVRYWSPTELKKVFSELIGPTQIQIDGFFSANIQKSDLALLGWQYRFVIQASEFLKRHALKWPFLRNWADSVYLQSSKK